MPELPEVETMVRGVRNVCAGRIIVRTEFVRCTRRPIVITPDRKSLIQQVQGHRIMAVSRLAKRIMLQLDGGNVIVIEPRMTGLLLISEPPTAQHRRVVWHFDPRPDQAGSLEFWDRRGLGTISLLNPGQLEQLRFRIGPDALEITDAEWYERLGSTTRETKVALLDQQLVAGIGNLYASEILHRSRISPLRRADTLGRLQISRLAAATREILNEAICCEGSTLSDGTYRNALNSDGSYQNHHRVYQKAGQLCPSCGKVNIQRIVQAQRATFFCPKCQK